MKSFQYVVVDTDGLQRHGIIKARSLKSAIETLEQSGSQIRAIEQVDDPAAPSVEGLVGGDTTNQTQVHCAAIIENAVGNVARWTEALEPLAASWPTSEMRREVSGIKRDLARSPKRSFHSEEFIGQRIEGKRLTRAIPYAITEDEASFEVWADSFRGESQRSGQLVKLLVYPVVLLVAALALCTWLACWVMPDFENMFDEMGLELPYPTWLALEAARQLRENFIVCLIGIVAVVTITAAIGRYMARAAIPTRLFGAWFSGTSAALSATAFFAKSLAELLDKNVPLAEALNFSGAHCGHALLRQDALRLASLVENGISPLELKASAEFIPPTLLQALIQPKGQPSVRLLRQLAESYRRRSENMVSILLVAIPPIAIGLVGLVVAFVLLSLFAPLVRMVTSLA